MRTTDVTLAAVSLAVGVSMGVVFMVVNKDWRDVEHSSKYETAISFECGRSYEIAKMSDHLDDYVRELQWCVPFVMSARAICKGNKDINGDCDYPLSSRRM
jgi:hypothetical protein